MISYLKIKNYKSFPELFLDLRGKNGKPKKLSLIYGENGAGKSNLISSILFLIHTVQTMNNVEKLSKLNKEDIFSNLIDIDDDKKKILIEMIVNDNFFTLENLIKENKTLQSKENMIIQLGFQIEDKGGEYTVEFDNQSIVKEELKYNIKERSGKFFSLSSNNYMLSPSIFTDITYKKELSEMIRKYWGKHTFMSILWKEYTENNHEFMDSVIQKPFHQIIDFFKQLSVRCKIGTMGEKGRLTSISHLFSNLESGEIQESQRPKLKAIESLLNTFYTSLYSDIKKVYYQYNESDALSYQLYLQKLIGGSLVDVPFSLESTGTQKLLDILPYILSAVAGETSLVDEIDSGIHDVMMCELFDLIQDSISGQLIITTHNTLLMKKVSPENCYIIQIDANGNKSIRCIKDYEFRTQKYNSIQSKYLNGDYEGIPNIGYLDLDELVQDFFLDVDK